MKTKNKKKKNVIIYLSHPTENRIPITMIDNLRKTFKSYSKITIIDPFKKVESHKFENIAQEEINLIKKSDLMFAYLPQPSIGVAMEIFTAMLFHKKIILVAPPQIQEHPWIQWIFQK